MLASSMARKRRMTSFALEASIRPVMLRSIRAKNSPTSEPRSIDREPLAVALVGQARRTRRIPTPAAMSLM